MRWYTKRHLRYKTHQEKITFKSTKVVDDPIKDIEKEYEKDLAMLTNKLKRLFFKLGIKKVKKKVKILIFVNGRPKSQIAYFECKELRNLEADCLQLN